ncbi:exonuclease 1-like isoform X2 [Triticum dicoccoides]|uniref:exonuclease 1-like isoform X2 n=1 Tax=Triticum dicoccoides TaxID=85692 RepID=UPI0018918F17|nr:exonuclease 1-like isoform X2 [Triticum dicoccoides]
MTWFCRHLPHCLSAPSFQLWQLLLSYRVAHCSVHSFYEIHLSPNHSAEEHRVMHNCNSLSHLECSTISSHVFAPLNLTRHIEYCMHRVNLLRHHGVKPILVLDGGFFPMKSEQEVKRARSRKENLEHAREHEATGNYRAAFDCYQIGVDITPKIAFELIQIILLWLRERMVLVIYIMEKNSWNASTTSFMSSRPKNNSL